VGISLSFLNQLTPYSIILKENNIILHQADKLLSAGFIKEAQYTTWLSNVVLVKKANGKWRMCADYTDLNKACPRDAYPHQCSKGFLPRSFSLFCLGFGTEAYWGEAKSSFGLGCYPKP